MQDLPNGGGGGRADASICPRALETLATPLTKVFYKTHPSMVSLAMLKLEKVTFLI